MIARSRLSTLDMIIRMGEMMKLSAAMVNRCRWKLPKHRQAMTSRAVLSTADTARDARRLVWRYHSPLRRFKHDFPVLDILGLDTELFFCFCFSPFMIFLEPVCCTKQ